MTDTLAILEKVNAFYTASFGQLITYTAGLFAFIGVLFPLLIARVQERQLRVDRSALEALIQTEIASAREKFQTDMSEALAKNEAAFLALHHDAQERFSAQLDKSEARASAAALHLQGNLRRHESPSSALFDFICAGGEYIRGSDEGNLKATLRAIRELCPRVYADQFHADNFAEEFEVLMTGLKELNVNGRYRDDVWQLPQLMSEAQSRKRPEKA